MACQCISVHACSGVVKGLMSLTSHSHDAILCVSSAVTLAGDLTGHWKVCHPEQDLSHSSVVTAKCHGCPAYLLASESQRDCGGLAPTLGGTVQTLEGSWTPSLARMASQRGCLLRGSPLTGHGGEGRGWVCMPKESVPTCWKLRSDVTGVFSGTAKDLSCCFTLFFMFTSPSPRRRRSSAPAGIACTATMWRRWTSSWVSGWWPYVRGSSVT